MNKNNTVKRRSSSLRRSHHRSLLRDEMFTTEEIRFVTGELNRLRDDFDFRINDIRTIQNEDERNREKQRLNIQINTFKSLLNDFNHKINNIRKDLKNSKNGGGKRKNR
jgi:hypothetical protein